MSTTVIVIVVLVWIALGFAFAAMLLEEYGMNIREFLRTLGIIMLGPIPWALVFFVLAVLGVNDWRERRRIAAARASERDAHV